MDSQRNTLQVWHEELCFVDTSAKLLAPPVFWLPARIQVIHYFWTAYIFCLKIPHSFDVHSHGMSWRRPRKLHSCSNAASRVPVHSWWFTTWHSWIDSSRGLLYNDTLQTGQKEHHPFLFKSTTAQQALHMQNARVRVWHIMCYSIDSKLSSEPAVAFLFREERAI
jgi:hypothetical protein